MNNVQSKFRRTGVVALIALVVVGGVTYTVSAWSTPGVNPPAGNVSGPITTGATAQAKSGTLGVLQLFTNNLGALPLSWSGIHTGDLFVKNRTRSNQYCLGAAGGSDAINCINSWSQLEPFIPVPNLQKVTDMGYTTTRPIAVTGNLVVQKDSGNNALVQVKAGVSGVARLDLETDTTNDASMIQYSNRGLTITGNALDVINLQVPNVAANTKITSPQYCIGTSCIAAWPPKPSTACIAGQALTWNGTAYSCVAMGGADNLGNHTAITDLNMNNRNISGVAWLGVQGAGVNITNALVVGGDTQFGWPNDADDAATKSYVDLMPPQMKTRHVSCYNVDPGGPACATGSYMTNAWYTGVSNYRAKTCCYIQLYY